MKEKQNDGANDVCSGIYNIFTRIENVRRCRRQIPAMLMCGKEEAGGEGWDGGGEIAIKRQNRENQTKADAWSDLPIYEATFR